MSVIEALRRRPGWRLELAVAVGVGVFLGLLGPFGSYLAGSPHVRIAYWVGMVVSGSAVFGTAARFVAASGRRKLNMLPRLAAVTVILALPYAAFTMAIARSVWPATAQLSPLEWYAQVLVLAIPLVLMATLGLQRWTSAGRAPMRTKPSIPLLGAHPPTILCLQMEDHYVRVHTTSGSSLVLATMSQAREALAGTRGLQVHRSWWVAEHAVAEATQHGRNLRLRLQNSLIVPVARSAVAEVRAAGWLTD